MESGLFLIGLLIALFALYRMAARKLSSPQARVRALLRHYHSLAKTGMPEQECLLRIMNSRTGWKNLPPAFLGEIVARLASKENLFRFVSLAEGYRFDRALHAVAHKNDVEEALRKSARWLVDFGNRLQKDTRLKEAEFVQKLAWALQPNQFFTNLPLASTYYKMERYDEAVPLFEAGLAQIEGSRDEQALTDGLEPGVTLQEFKARQTEMHKACLKAASSKRRS